MSQLSLNQQSVDSWTVSNNKTSLQVAWITQLKNRLDNSNKNYQVVIRSGATYEFSIHSYFHSLEEAVEHLKRCNVAGGDE